MNQKIRAVFCVSKYVFCFASEFKTYELKILTPRRLTPLCNTFEISASFYHFIRLKLFCALLMNWQHILCDERTDSTKIKSSKFIFINSVHWLCVCVSVRVRICVTDLCVLQFDGIQMKILRCILYEQRNNPHYIGIHRITYICFAYFICILVRSPSTPDDVKFVLIKKQ